MPAKPSAGYFVSDQRGASAVEFAIVSPVLIVMLIGIVMFGWAMHSVHTVRLAVEEAGRALLLNNSLTQTQLQAMVQANLASVGAPSATLSLAADSSVAGVTAKRISATSAFTISVPFLPDYGITYTTSVVVPISS